MFLRINYWGIALLPFFFIYMPPVVGMFGGLTLQDTRGNKYTFKKDSIFCRNYQLNPGNKTPIFVDECVGSAIKKDIAGKREAVEFGKKFCDLPSNRDEILCVAAKKFGKF